ncbi:MAG: thiolase family protein [Chloroflexi bacterium]|nr:thiolase family protein [Chloroflexota bacterium]
MREAVIVDSVRTPLGKSFRGSLNITRPDDMLAQVIDELFTRHPELDKAAVEDVTIGCGFPEGAQGLNVARVAGMLAGLPTSVPGQTINRFCASGSQAVATAANQVIQDGLDIVVAGGVETISLIDDGSRNMSHLVNPKVREGFPAIYWVMGRTAEVVAERYGVSREDQDAYALRSQLRTARAQREGIFADEIVPVSTMRRVTPKEGEPYDEAVTLEQDECNRPDSTLEGLAKLPSAFTRDGSGSVTAGNSSQFSDGASATLVMSAERAKQLGLAPLGIYRGTAVAGVDPDEMGIGPAKAVPRLLEKAGLTVKDIDLWELNEAFAVQVLQVQRMLDLPEEALNVNGGAISIGHPYGVTGSRQVGHLLRELKRRGGRYGVVTMCVGGGQGFASLFEAV